MSIDVLIPQIGESVATVFIAKWRAKVGDLIVAGAPIMDLDSDKASMEVPSPSSGRITELLVAEGDEVPVLSVVARIDETATAGAAPATSAPAPAPASATEVKAGPAARAAAAEKGVELGGVAGSGKGGRVTTSDVAQAAAPTPAPAPVAAPSPAAAAPAPARVPTGDRVERVKMSPLRRTIARRLVEAQATAAMLTTFNEVDLSAAMAMRKRYQDTFVEKHGVKLGFMSFFVKAAVEALKEFPAVNAEIDGNDIVYKRYYNIGVAVSGPKGLVVPVVRDADRLSFAEVEKSIAALGKRARDGKLELSDFEDGTFTVSNGGTFGSMMSTPILNPPQSGILGMHNIVDRPVVVDGQIVIRPMMYLAMTYDHRIIDGREAVSFLVRIKQCVENPERMLLEV